MTTQIPHVNDLAAERIQRERIARLGRRPYVPTPKSLAEMHAYLIGDDIPKLVEWMDANREKVRHPLTGAANGLTLYEPGEASALNFLTRSKDQFGFPSAYATDKRDVDAVVARHLQPDYETQLAGGNYYWAWLYLQSYADWVAEQRKIGAAGRDDLRAVVDQMKPIEKPALKQAQLALAAFHRTTKEK